MIDLRRTFISWLVKEAEKDPAIVLIVPDVGFSFIEDFQKKFPDRYFNLGVTEQSAIIIATGMALNGLKPYVYSMINFVLFRSFEMVRNAVGYHNANVKLLGVKGSEKYKFLGFSHNIVEKEDLHVLKKIPNIKGYIPTTEKKLISVLDKTYKSKKPSYIRL